MPSLQEQVKEICNLTDSVLKNPSDAIDETAKKIGVSSPIVAFAAGAAFIPGPWLIGGIIATIWKKFKDKEKAQQEKERMLREVIRRQQAVIRELERQQASNRTEINNLKRMLNMLEETEKKIKAA